MRTGRATLSRAIVLFVITGLAWAQHGPGSLQITVGASTAAASQVTVGYPFSFVMLNPVANLVASGSTLGGAPLTITASAEMRNESQ